MPRKDYEQHRGKLLDRPRHTATNLPTITPYLKKMGVHKWCSEELPENDCTGNPRITQYTKQTPAVIRQKFFLQKIITTLYQQYHEIRIKDIALIVGYSQQTIYHLMDWEVPRNFDFNSVENTSLK